MGSKGGGSPIRATASGGHLMAKRAALWRCPRCGHRFTSPNLSHSCGNYRLAAHFLNRPPLLRQLFDRLRAVARACGPVTVYAQKTRIVFQSRVRFGAAIVHKDWLEATLWRTRQVEHACVLRHESLGAQGYNVHFRLTSLADTDPALEALVRQAYAEHR
jgi:hypothetical protein